MNKRTFIKLIGAVAASRIVSPLVSWAAKNKLTNWAGNLKYSTDQLYSANSLEQVTTYVKKQNRLKVLGTRHCFNNIADSSHGFLSLKPMDEVVALDQEARIVTIDAGMTYGQLCPILHRKGFALHHLASLRTRRSNRAVALALFFLTWQCSLFGAGDEIMIEFEFDGNRGSVSAHAFVFRTFQYFYYIFELAHIIPFVERAKARKNWTEILTESSRPE